MATSSTKIAWLLIAAFLAGVDVAANARTLTLDAQRLVDARVSAERVHLRLEDGVAAALAISAERISIAQLGLSGRLDWSCALQRDAIGGSSCAGPVHLRNGEREQVADLAVRVADGRVELSLSHAGSRVMLGLPFDAAAPIAASLQRVPAAWIEQPLASVMVNV